MAPKRRPERRAHVTIFNRGPLAVPLERRGRFASSAGETPAVPVGTTPHASVFGKDGETLIILVGGGTKKRQRGGIEVAKHRWQDYKRRQKTAKKAEK